MKEGLKIIPAKWIDKVLEVALERQPVPLTDDDAVTPPEAPAAPVAAKKSSRGAAVKH